MPNETPASPSTTPNKERAARLIRAIWSALLGPSWTKDELIALGKLVYAKVLLKDIDAKIFQQLLPRLNQMAQQLIAEMDAEAPTPSAKQEGDDA